MQTRPYAVLFTGLAVLAGGFLLYSLADTLLLLFMAVLVSQYLGALAAPVERYLKVRKGLAVAASVTLTGVVLFGMGALILPALTQQGAALMQEVPRTLTRWEGDVLAFAQQYPALRAVLEPPIADQSYVGKILEEAGAYFAQAAVYVVGGAHVVVRIVSVLVMGVFLASRPRLYREGMVTLFPPKVQGRIRATLVELGRVLRVWIVGQGIYMATMGFLTWIGLLLLGVPYALAFGVFTGISTIVPIFGTVISISVPALFMLAAGETGVAFGVAVLGIGVHVVEANVVAPAIFQAHGHLPPVLTLMSVLVMAQLLGPLGLIVAVPSLAATMTIVQRLYLDVRDGKAPADVREMGSG